MNNILKYQREHEDELLALLRNEPDWSSFVGEDVIDAFKEALLDGETYLYESQGTICGYIRAMVDIFGIYISELYITPVYRGNTYGAALLGKVRQTHPNQAVYVLSDEDRYYEKLDCKRVGSIFQL